MNLWDKNERIVAVFEDTFENIKDTVAYKEEWAIGPKPENAIVSDATLSDGEAKIYKSVCPKGLRTIIVPTDCGNVVLHEKVHEAMGRVIFIAAPYVLSSMGLVPISVIPYAGDIRRICGEAGRPNIGEVYKRFTAYVLEINQDSRQSSECSTTFLKSVT